MTTPQDVRDQLERAVPLESTRRSAVDTRGKGPDDPDMDLHERVAKVEAVLPTLATKSDLADLKTDLFKALSDQTWKIIGAALSSAAILLAGIKFLH